MAGRQTPQAAPGRLTPAAWQVPWIKQKLGRYRPEILSGYTQADVDEPIEPSY